MPADAKHPLYQELIEDWTMLDDVYAGERKVKEAGQKYLPATSGMHADGLAMTQPGGLAYAAYKKRAKFPTSFRDAVEAMVGVMHGKPPEIKLPAALEPLRYNATPTGESLEGLLRRINEHQLRKGRLGLALDVPSGRGPSDTIPFLVLYEAQHIINWDVFPRESGLNGLSMVVVDESGQRREPDLSWKDVKQVRVMSCAPLPGVAGVGSVAAGPATTGEDNPMPAPPAGSLSLGLAPTDPKYVYAKIEDDGELAGAQWRSPSVAGRTLSRLPFVIINHSDLVADPDQPPLLGLANSVLTIYRGEADYRQALFMQGQDTLVVIGWEPTDGKIGEVADNPTPSFRLGAGANITLPKDGDAKFIGTDSQGLVEMREALQNDYDDAAAQGVRIIDQAGGLSHQSGDALRTRVAAKTATLTGIAKAGAEALETLLELAAEWVGADPKEVSVTPNIDFASTPMTGQEAVQWMTAKKLGFPISLLSIHAMAAAREATTMTYEEELDSIEAEPVEGTKGRGVPDDPVTGTPPAKGPSGAKSGPKPKSPPV